MGKQLRSDDAKRLDSFVATCRTKGLAVTPQRVAVMRAVLASAGHPRAEQVYDVVQRSCPHISLATIHRTLETLCQIDELHKVTPLHLSARYDGNLHPHHHLVCVRCHHIEDIQIPALDSLLLAPLAADGFKPLHLSAEIRGLCKRCNRPSQRNATRSHHAV